MDALQNFFAAPFQNPVAFFNGWPTTPENDVRIRVFAAALWAAAAVAVWSAFHVGRASAARVAGWFLPPLADEIGPPARPGWKARVGQAVRGGVWGTVVTLAGYAALYAVSFVCYWFPPTKTVPLGGGDRPVVVTFVWVQTAGGGLWAGETEVTEAVYGWSVGVPAPADRADLPVRGKSLPDYERMIQKVAEGSGAGEYEADGRTLNPGRVRFPTPAELTALVQNLPADTAGIERNGYVKGNSGGRVHPVKSMPPHWGKYAGVYGLYGNVMEVGRVPGDAGRDSSWVVAGLSFRCDPNEANLAPTPIAPIWLSDEAIGLRLVASDTPNWRPDRFALGKFLHAAGWVRPAGWALAGLALLAAAAAWASAAGAGWGVALRVLAAGVAVGAVGGGGWAVAEYLW